MTPKFLYEYVEAEQEAQLAIKEKETKETMTDYDNFMRFVKGLRIPFEKLGVTHKIIAFSLAESGFYFIFYLNGNFVDIWVREKKDE